MSLEDEFAVSIPDEMIPQIKTIKDIVEFIDGKLQDKFEHIDVDDVLIDGKSSDDVGELVLKDREMLSNNGIIIS